MQLLSIPLALGLQAAFAAAHPPGYGSSPKSSWNLKKFTSLVAFGDSYTDESRLGYFGANGGSPPPVGWIGPESNNTASGGYIWDRYVSFYTGANLYDYAVSGAVCSNDITPRTFDSINAPFPAVQEYEVPAFIADSSFVNATTGKKALNIPPTETVYSMWIGTNDLGNYAFISDSQVMGKTLVDYTNCVFSALDEIYKNGGRYFVLMNNAPLWLTPQYGRPEAGGLAQTSFWPDKPANITEISYKMQEYVVSTNAIFSYQAPFELLIKNRYPGANIAFMDMEGFLTHIYENPEQYLNGTAPLNVDGYINHCDLTGANCVRAESPDSYMWFDALHPSEQTDRNIAKEFVKVVGGESEWATYWSSSSYGRGY